MPETSRQRASRLWRERNPERHSELQRQYREQNLEKTKLAVWRSNLKRKYGITEVEYYALLDKQDGQCAICTTHCLDLPERLSVDHDHETGEIRGLLCRFCNLALGCMGDGEVALERLRATIQYLERER
jgi:hypothetical protein